MRSFVALLLLMAPTVFAQSTATSATEPQPRFVIADVHASKTLPGYAGYSTVLRDGLYISRDATMLNLIEAAYGVQEDSIAGGPGWITNDRFDVVAKIPEGTTAQTANLMLQSLLAERFGLVVRNENSPQPRYVLSAGKVPRLKPATGAGDPACQRTQEAVASTGPTGPGDFSQVPNIKLNCKNLTSALLANYLRGMAGDYLNHDVVDTTNLKGGWDFDLEWTSRYALAGKGADGISIFDAVDKQLGLKLELQNVPLPSLVIAKVNRRPSPNASDIAAALALPVARFEVAAIKHADPNGRPFTGIGYTGGTQVRAGGTLRDLMRMTLEIEPNVAADLIVGLPKWADTEKWDITAKLPTTGEGSPFGTNGQMRPPPFSVALEMLRGLLLDQFELKTHTEDRETTVYVLSATGKTKLVNADEAERMGCTAIQNPPKPGHTIETTITCKNASMDDFARELTQIAGAYIDHPIVNATGLEGGWDFEVSWTPIGIFQKAQAANQNAEDASVPGGITLWEAVDKQLGLKLVKEKRSIPVVVVDHVDEEPLN